MPAFRARRRHRRRARIRACAAPASETPGPRPPISNNSRSACHAERGRCRKARSSTSPPSADAELLENIAVNVRKLGAFPIVEYSSDRLAKRLFFDVPEKYDAQANKVGAELAKIVDVGITLANTTSQELFEGADPKRTAARGKANEPVEQAFLKNNVRLVEVGNDLYPTPWRAERYGMTEDALADTFWNGVNIDYSELQARGEQVKKTLAAGNEVHITNPNGTDLKVRVQGRPVLVSDGISSAEDIKQGGAAVSVTAGGRGLHHPVARHRRRQGGAYAHFFRGKKVDNLTLTFAAARRRRWPARVRAMPDSRPYDAVETAQGLVRFVDLGINPRDIAENTIGTWVPAGTVTVGTGVNTWAGGDNSVPYGLTVYLPGSTVMLDGKAIVEKGVLKL